MNRRLIVALTCVFSLALLIGFATTDSTFAQKKKKSKKPHKFLAKPDKLTKKAPAKFKVRFFTTKGNFDVLVTREWAPLAADRFFNLVGVGYYDDVVFFRVIKGFMAQFGVHGDPAVSKAWKNASIKDDKVTQSNKRGMLSFATAGPNTRTTQLFINYGDNSRLDGMGFSPFAKVLGDGMKVVDKLYNGYGEGAPQGNGPEQGKIQAEGNKYLNKEFPKLDSIKGVRFIK